MKDLIEKRVFYVLLFIIIFCITFCYSMFLTPSISDEIWSYSFCYNIASGLIPYRDFNMVITPLFSLLGSIFVKIFGNYLFSIHIFAAIWVGIIMVMLFKLLKWKSFVFYVYILLYHSPTYNFLCLLWIFIILYSVSIKKDNDIIMGIIVSFCFLTKQTIGMCLFIPYLYYSKNKLKSIIIFFIPVILCIVFLIYKGAFYQFIDYCFLGMFDFGSNNPCYSFIVPEAIVLIYLFYKLLRSEFKDKQCFYILMFQIIAFPIVDAPHFFIAFSTVVYYLINRDINSKKDWYHLFYVIAFGVAYLIVGLNLDFTIVKENNFMYLRNANLKLMELDKQTSIINKYDDRYDYKFYILDTACFLKLYMSDTINKFDILNNGNFGYKGSLGYIKDIDNLCNNNSCVFFVAYWYYDEVEGQFNKDILDYVVKNYNLIDKYKYFDVYSNS